MKQEKQLVDHVSCTKLYFKLLCFFSESLEAAEWKWVKGKSDFYLGFRLEIPCKSSRLIVELKAFVELKLNYWFFFFACAELESRNQLRGINKIVAEKWIFHEMFFHLSRVSSVYQSKRYQKYSECFYVLPSTEKYFHISFRLD